LRRRALPISRRCGGGDGPAAAEAAAAEEEEVSGDKGCVFCAIVRGESPAFKVYEDDVCLCILDSNPLSHGHSLIIPKCHFPSLEATPPPVVAAMCSKVPFLSNAIMKAAQCDSFNLVVNNGSAAGQVIFHTHFHIIPRKAGDQLWPSESFRRRPLERNQETIGLVNSIKEHLCASPCGESQTEGSVAPKDL
ncbi:adenylylsulfatase HINT3, partial [Ananas comosus]|uniref:Adenylylsulfatase HINT3 n=1 Tax=Ananas comosus TaxID=4615 RepID=A0A6P5GH43_ANACO